MVIVSGADEPIVGNVHQLPQIQHAPVAQHDIIHELLGGNARFLSLVLDLLTMLVGSRQEHHIVALKPIVSVWPPHGNRRWCG